MEKNEEEEEEGQERKKERGGELEYVFTNNDQLPTPDFQQIRFRTRLRGPCALC